MRLALVSSVAGSGTVAHKPVAKPQPKYVLIVEDETDLAELLRYNLEREGYVCRCVAAGDTALEAVRVRPPDLLLLDRMLPRLSGDEVVARLKRDPVTASIPVIVLTAKGEETDQLVGFALGADDYVTKPFSMKVLLARTAAMLRRAESLGESPEVLSAGPVTLNLGRYEVTVAGAPVGLTVTEFRLLRALMAARGRVLQRSRLIEAALGRSTVVTDRTIDVHVTALRKKLGPAAKCVQTIRGVGYTFRPPA